MGSTGTGPRPVDALQVIALLDFWPDNTHLGTRYPVEETISYCLAGDRQATEMYSFRATMKKGRRKMEEEGIRGLSTISFAGTRDPWVPGVSFPVGPGDPELCPARNTNRSGCRILLELTLYLGLLFPMSMSQLTCHRLHDES